MFHIVAAADLKLGIGKNGIMPWRIKAESTYFAKLTKQTKNPALKNAVIMGRTTWESLPPKFKPLPERLNIVLTRSKNYVLPNSVIKAGTLDEALKIAQKHKVERIFVIGGGSVYHAAIIHPSCQSIYLTQIQAVFDCDTFFPEIDLSLFEKHILSEIQEEKGLKFQFLEYVRKI